MSKAWKKPNEHSQCVGDSTEKHSLLAKHRKGYDEILEKVYLKSIEKSTKSVELLWSKSSQIVFQSVSKCMENYPSEV